jgi:hypothetical protein
VIEYGIGAEPSEDAGDNDDTRRRLFRNHTDARHRLPQTRADQQSEITSDKRHTLI